MDFSSSTADVVFPRRSPAEWVTRPANVGQVIYFRASRASAADRRMAADLPVPTCYGPPFALGAVVWAHSLTLYDSNLNGLRGVVHGFDDQIEMYEVFFFQTGQMRKLPATKLRLIPGAIRGKDAGNSPSGASNSNSVSPRQTGFDKDAFQLSLDEEFAKRSLERQLRIVRKERDELVARSESSAADLLRAAQSVEQRKKSLAANSIASRGSRRALAPQMCSSAADIKSSYSIDASNEAHLEYRLEEQTLQKQRSCLPATDSQYTNVEQCQMYRDMSTVVSDLDDFQSSILVASDVRVLERDVSSLDTAVSNAVPLSLQQNARTLQKRFLLLNQGAPKGVTTCPESGAEMLESNLKSLQQQVNEALVHAPMLEERTIVLRRRLIALQERLFLPHPASLNKELSALEARLEELLRQVRLPASFGALYLAPSEEVLETMATTYLEARDQGAGSSEHATHSCLSSRGVVVARDEALRPRFHPERNAEQPNEYVKPCELTAPVEVGTRSAFHPSPLQLPSSLQQKLDKCVATRAQPWNEVLSSHVVQEASHRDNEAKLSAAVLEQRLFDNGRPACCYQLKPSIVRAHSPSSFSDWSEPAVEPPSLMDLKCTYPKVLRSPSHEQRHFASPSLTDRKLAHHNQMRDEVPHCASTKHR